MKFHSLLEKSPGGRVSSTLGGMVNVPALAGALQLKLTPTVPVLSVEFPP